MKKNGDLADRLIRLLARDTVEIHRESNIDRVLERFESEPYEVKLEQLVGRSKPMQEVYRQIRQAAVTDMPILLMGETGTGKDLAAQAIHEQSERKDKPYIAVNLGALPSELVGSELFGHEKGSFTGAVGRREGKFEQARDGTVFLDEIATVDAKVQVSLLRLIEQKTFHRLGGKTIIRTQARLIAASNQILPDLVEQGRFRKDLYYRLDEASIFENAPFESLVRLALEMHRNVFFTLDEAGRFTGAISLQDFKYVLSHPKELMHVHNINDFKQNLSPVSVTQSLDAVVDRFAETGFDRLPVVDAQQKLVGSVIMGDIMRQYNQEVANRNITIELGARINAHDISHTLHIGSDTVVAEIDVPQWMVGKQLSDLKLRTRYHVSVFIVKEMQEHNEPRFVTPNAAYTFREGDTILVSGADKDIDALKNNA